MKLVAPALLFLQLVAAAPGFAATELRLLPASQVWLDGTTNVHKWDCVGKSLEAELSIDAPAAELERRLDGWQRLASGARLDGASDQSTSWDAEVELRIPISALRCGNAAMEQDMRKALRAASYPMIAFRFVRLREARYAPAGAVPSFGLQVEGEISLAGTSRSVAVNVTATRLSSHRFQLRGGLPLRMTDFGIDPPVALLGLIRARDEIWVSVDLQVGL
jgi:polyisoprenoid-binding protein YceI